MYPSFFDLEAFHSPIFIFQTPARDSNKGDGLAIYISNTKFAETAISIPTGFSETEAPEQGEFLFMEIDTGHKIKILSLEMLIDHLHMNRLCLSKS